MIELQHICKTYKAKKGRKTVALDDVSIKFHDSGMTFLLGKSGSGKSTLLNLIGGLDKYDSGNMILFGKSSKDFSQADFDSYRNTYVGFVFQEFNVLENYDVYENIVLSLQLQQKKIDDDEIDSLLEKLELKPLKYRKMNELSGGQKQRVAIARALIKNPKIILADEPTGNLDSKTGSQVMELLKEISKEKLVIIVSHDEESARKYGDRIIEVKDGKVIGDTNPSNQVNTKEKYQIIKSKLPFLESFKLGIGSLKHKKVKLFFTILLIVFTLGFLSCTDTLSNFDYVKGHVNKLIETKEEFVQIEKHYYDEENYDDFVLEIDDNDLNNIHNKMNSNGYLVYRFFPYNSASSVFDTLKIKVNQYSGDSTTEIVMYPKISDILNEEIVGREPSSKNEIVISNKVADLIIENGIDVHESIIDNEYLTSTLFEPKTYEDILNSSYTYFFGDEGKVKIVGIIKYDEDKYNLSNYAYKVFASDQFLENFSNKESNFLKEYYNIEVKIDGKIKENYNQYNALNHEIEYYDGNSWQRKSSLEENEILFSKDDIIDSSKYYDALEIYRNQNQSYDLDYDEVEKRFFENYIKNFDIFGKQINLTISYGNKENIYKKYDDLKVIGVIFNNSEYCNYVSDKVLTNDLLQAQFQLSAVLYKMNDSDDYINVLSKYKDNNDYEVRTSYSDEVNMVKNEFDAIKKIVLYIGLAFLAFTVILIANFIVTSIGYRKKEIGILRALGASSMDVSKIFLWEGIAIALISGILASILLVVVTNKLNDIFITKLHYVITPFIVGVRQFIVIYLVVFIVVIISTLLPLRKITKMKPIDAILNK